MVKKEMYKVIIRNFSFSYIGINSWNRRIRFSLRPDPNNNNNAFFLAPSISRQLLKFIHSFT